MLNIKLENKRWFIAGAAVIMQLCFGTVHAWSVYKKPLILSYGWSEISTQAVYMVMMGFFGLSSIFVGELIDKKGPRFVSTLGGILFGIGTLIAGLAAEMGNIWLLYFGYGLLGGLGCCLGYVTPISSLIKWFPDKRGLMSGLAVMGFGAGSFFMGMIAPKMIINIGVGNTFYIWGIIFLVLVVVSAQLCINPTKGWLPTGFTLPVSHVPDHASYTFSEAIKKYQWWVLWGMLFLNVSVGFGLISQLSPLAQDVIKYNDPEKTPAALAMAGGMVMAVAAIFNGLGRLIWAWISDLVGRKNTFIFMFISQAILYIYLPSVDNVILFTIIACYLLSCFGGGFATMPAFTADAFGPAHIGKIYGMLLTALSVAGVTGPMVFAQMKGIALYIAAALLILGFILVCFFKKPVKNVLKGEFGASDPGGNNG